MQFDHTFYMLEHILTTVNFVPFLLSVLGYVLSSLALYSIASRRAINHPWLSWVPVANIWILGSLSDQYRYVAKGQRKNKRKILLGLKIATAVVSVVAFILAIAGVFGITFGLLSSGMGDEDVFAAVFGGVMGVLGLLVLLLPLYITTAVFRFMALYDVYTSLDPDNSVLFLVLSIFFRVTEPFFLFFNREKEKGMPPRRGYSEPAPGHEVPPRSEEQPRQTYSSVTNQYQVPPQEAPASRETPAEPCQDSGEDQKEL